MEHKTVFIIEAPITVHQTTILNSRTIQEKLLSKDRAPSYLRKNESLL